MQSGQAGNPNTSSSPALNPQLNHRAPSPDEFQKTLPQAETPKGFIEKILNESSPDVQSPATTVAPPEAPVTPAPAAAKTADPEPVFFDEKPAEKAPAAAATVDEPDDLAELPDEDKEAVAAQHFKTLKTKYRDKKQEAREAKAALAAAQADLERYKNGEVIPEVLAQKESEIQRLSFFEKLHNLKGSPEYAEKIIKPLTDTEDALKKKFSDYEVPDESLDTVVNQALKFEKESELNGFLAEHFDPVAAIEAKQLINQARQLRDQARAAEAEPTKILTQLQQESEAARAARDSQRKAVISATARDAWVKSLFSIREKNQIQELIRKDNDPAFNQKFVDPLLAHASVEYGRIVTELARAGVTELTPDLAEALATMTLHATVAGVATTTRNIALQHAEELQSNTSRLNSMARPMVGGGVASSSPAPAAARPTTAEEDAQALINSVLSKKRA